MTTEEHTSVDFLAPTMEFRGDLFTSFAVLHDPSPPTVLEHATHRCKASLVSVQTYERAWSNGTSNLGPRKRGTVYNFVKCIQVALMNHT